MELLKQYNMKLKEQEGRFLGALLAPLVPSVVQPMISSVVKDISGRGFRREGRRYINKKILTLLHLLNNIEITNYFIYKPKFNDVFSRNNLPRIKDEVYVVNLDDKESKWTPCVSLSIDRNGTIYFDSFEIEYIPQEVLTKIKDKPIIHDIFRIQDN